MNQRRTIQDYRNMEAQIFPKIPGLLEILKAPSETVSELEAEFPDAAFALRTANDLFQHNRELSIITQKAYFSILEGEKIADVRARYDKELTEYWNSHMWDD